MNKFIEDVTDFHKKFGFALPDRPNPLQIKHFITKAGHLLEESTEFLNSVDDPAKQLDALVDVVYVALGAAILSGYPFEEAWRAVHSANMTKIRTNRAIDSQRNSEFDVIKPPGFIPPDIQKILDATNMERPN